MTKFTYRQPSLEDGGEIWRMVDESGNLDQDSGYAYVMVCRNFPASSVVAETPDGEIAGMLTAYPLPQDPSRLFVWQVTTREPYKRQGVATGMLHEVLDREEAAATRYVEATIVPENKPAEALFRGFARDVGVPIKETEAYADELFPDAEHKIERLFVIGPLASRGAIRVRREEGRYSVYLDYDGNELPAFEPVNPSFAERADAERAAQEAKAAHKAKRVEMPD